MIVWGGHGDSGNLNTGGKYKPNTDSWTATKAPTLPATRSNQTALWTGSEMIIWGGFNLPAGSVNSGARYDPSTDSWTATSITNAPTRRMANALIWTGSEMIVWGGWDTNHVFNTGARYNPASNTWTAMTVTNAPTARLQHTAVWTGSKMIIWGGASNTTGTVNSGGLYDPGTDSWTATSTTNAPERRTQHAAVWTGSEMIVWGGGSANNAHFNTGGKYNPNTDSWTTISTTNAPAGRSLLTAAWTGNEMIVWGGNIYDGVSHYFNTGGRYNPGTDSWIATSTVNAPVARYDHTAVWTGNEMIIWGGADGMSVFNSGGRYNPSTDNWIATATSNVPEARGQHTAVWTGSEMIIWGGGYDTGGRYCAQPSTPTVQSAASRKSHGNAGSFDLNLPLSGPSGIECRSGGATNDYTIVLTFLANVSVNGSPQAAVTSGIGTIGSAGTSNGGIVITSGNVVTIPLTNVSNAQAINVTLSNVNGSTNVMIPMRVLIGDVNGNGAVNATDVSQTKSCVGQAIITSNFRCDVDAGGTINATDVSMVKSKVGTALP